MRCQALLQAMQLGWVEGRCDPEHLSAALEFYLLALPASPWRGPGLVLEYNVAALVKGPILTYKAGVEHEHVVPLPPTISP